MCAFAAFFRFSSCSLEAHQYNLPFVHILFVSIAISMCTLSLVLTRSCANAIALFVDSFGPRNTLLVDPVTVRPYDLYAGYNFLSTDVTYSALVDSSRIYAVGWASGATAGAWSCILFLS
jgi:hypothetical protein